MPLLYITHALAKVEQRRGSGGKVLEWQEDIVTIITVTTVTIAAFHGATAYQASI